MDRELMTPVLDGIASPRSRITVASLEDMGYDVDYAKADVFTSFDIGISCFCAPRRQLQEVKSQRVKVIGRNERSLTLTTSKQPQISDKGYQKAVQYGKSILEAEMLPRMDGSFEMRTDTKFVGDQVVSVLYKEDEHIFSIIVTINS
jgi:hypothetical protein